MASVNKILGVLKNRLVEIEQLRLTGQTFIHRFQDEDVSLTTGDPEVVPFNVGEEDTRDEFSGGTFTPDQPGHYEFLIHMEFSVGGDQDELKVDLYDLDAGETLFESELRTSGGGNRDRSANSIERLEAGKDYQIRATNTDNDDTVNGKPKRTRLAIEMVNGSELPY